MRTQAGSYRLAVAVRYWQSAQVLISAQVRDGEYFEPVGYLIAMAAELTLKAFLIDRGVDDKTLWKSVGHDLGTAMKLAIERGLRVSEAEVRSILAMREPHKSHFNRYGPKSVQGNLQLGATLLAQDKPTLNCVAMLIDRISGDPKTLRRKWQHLADLDWPPTLPLLGWVSLQRFEALEQGMLKELEKIKALNETFASRL